MILGRFSSFASNNQPKVKNVGRRPSALSAAPRRAAASLPSPVRELMRMLCGHLKHKSVRQVRHLYASVLTRMRIMKILELLFTIPNSHKLAMFDSKIFH